MGGGQGVHQADAPGADQNQLAGLDRCRRPRAARSMSPHDPVHQRHVGRGVHRLERLDAVDVGLADRRREVQPRRDAHRRRATPIETLTGAARRRGTSSPRCARNRRAAARPGHRASPTAADRSWSRARSARRRARRRRSAARRAASPPITGNTRSFAAVRAAARSARSRRRRTPCPAGRSRSPGRSANASSTACFDRPYADSTPACADCDDTKTKRPTPHCLGRFDQPLGPETIHRVDHVVGGRLRRDREVHDRVDIVERAEHRAAPGSSRKCRSSSGTIGRAGPRPPAERASPRGRARAPASRDAVR